MSFIKDMISVFKKKELTFRESYKEADEVYTFLFEIDKSLTWNAGQYGLLSITHKSIKNGTKPFSIASAPSENVVRITTRISGEPSEFKQALLELKPGMSIKMGGPVGAFYPTDSRPSLFIAGGIGITPFRSILKQLEVEGSNEQKDIQLLYMDSNNTHLYKDELDRIATNTSIRITYMESKNELQQEIDKFIAKHKDNGNYFIAGPKSMVDDLTNYVKNQNIPKRNIKKDAFFGY